MRFCSFASAATPPRVAGSHVAGVKIFLGCGLFASSEPFKSSWLYHGSICPNPGHPKGKKKKPPKCKPEPPRTTSEPRPNHVRTTSEPRPKTAPNHPEPRPNHVRTTSEPRPNHVRTTSEPHPKFPFWGLFHLLQQARRMSSFEPDLGPRGGPDDEKATTCEILNRRTPVTNLRDECSARFSQLIVLRAPHRKIIILIGVSERRVRSGMRLQSSFQSAHML